MGARGKKTGSQIVAQRAAVTLMERPKPLWRAGRGHCGPTPAAWAETLGILTRPNKLHSRLAGKLPLFLQDPASRKLALQLQEQSLRAESRVLGRMISEVLQRAAGQPTYPPRCPATGRSPLASSN